MHELLGPPRPFSDHEFNHEFVGMTETSVSRASLLETQKFLLADIQDRLTGEVADFLLSLHDAGPDFNLIGLPSAANLPAVRWKLQNLHNLKSTNPKKHSIQRNKLEKLFR